MKKKTFFIQLKLYQKQKKFQDPAMAKGAGGKSGKYQGKQIRPSNITIDEDFFTTDRHHKEMEIALEAKFTQNEHMKKVLLATKDALLTHGTRGTPTQPMYSLMKIRASLRLKT